MTMNVTPSSTMTSQTISLSPAVLGPMPVEAFRLLSDAVAFVVRTIAFMDGEFFDDEALDGAIDQLDMLFVQGAERSTTMAFDDADGAVLEARMLCINVWVRPTSSLFRSIANAAYQVECMALGIVEDDDDGNEEGEEVDGAFYAYGNAQRAS